MNLETANTLEKLKTEQRKLREDYNNIYIKLSNIRFEIKDLVEKHLETQKLTLKDLLEVYHHGIESSHVFVECNNYFQKNGKNLIDASGYDYNTGQRIIRLKINPRTSNENLIWLENYLITEIIPIIKPHENKKIIDIFEHTLSEYGGYDLIIEDGIYTIFFSGRSIYSDSSLLSVLIYIRLHHYYE